MNVSQIMDPHVSASSPPYLSISQVSNIQTFMFHAYFAFIAMKSAIDITDETVIEIVMSKRIEKNGCHEEKRRAKE